MAPRTPQMMWMEALSPITGPRTAKNPRAEPAPTAPATRGLMNMASMQGTWAARVAVKNGGITTRKNPK